MDVIDKKFLMQVYAKQLAPRTENLVLIPSTATVSQTLQRLYATAILSAPVIEHKNNLILGSIDVMDILSYVLDVPKETQYAEKMASYKNKFTHSISQVIANSKREPFLPMSYGTPVGVLVANLFSIGIHRVPLFDEQNQLVSIISQMDVIPYVHRNLKSLGHLANWTMSQLDLLPANIVTIYEHASLRTAFEDISSCLVSGIAVVDKSGKLVGNLSASDFKGVTEHNFVHLDEPISEYIKHQNFVGTVHRDTTFEQAVALFHDTHVHRLFIVEEGYPIGIITLTDVCKIIKSHMTGIAQAC